MWDDRQITAGEEWKTEILRAIDTAAAILIVSVDFLNSEFIKNEEIPRLLKRKNDKGMPVFPLIIRPCSWTKVKWLSSIQARPKDGRPLSKAGKAKIEEDLTAFVEEIEQVLKKKRLVPTESEIQEKFRQEIAELYRLKGAEVTITADGDLQVVTDTMFGRR